MNYAVSRLLWTSQSGSRAIFDRSRVDTPEARDRLRMDSACVRARRRAHDAPEVSVQLALIAEPYAGRDLARSDARREQLLRAHDPQPREVGMRRQADLRSERAAQVELVSARMVGEIIERHHVVEALAKELDRATHRAGVLALHAADRGERGDCLGDSDLEREPTCAGLHRVVEALEGGAARVTRREMRMEASLADHALHGARRESDDLTRRRAVAREVAHDVTRLLNPERARRARPKLSAGEEGGAPRLDPGDRIG